MDWLGKPDTEFIHPAKFDGKMRVSKGVKPLKIHGWAQFECARTKLEKKSSALSVKFRTYLAGRGTVIIPTKVHFMGVFKCNSQFYTGTPNKSVYVGGDTNIVTLLIICTSYV